MENCCYSSYYLVQYMQCVKRGSVGNTQLLPHTKMLLVGQ